MLTLLLAARLTIAPQQLDAIVDRAVADDAFSGVVLVARDGAPVYTRTELLAGNRISGPALVEEHASTTVIAPDDIATVDAFGNLHIGIGGLQ